MLEFVGCVVKATVFHQILVLLVILRFVICNDPLNLLLSSPPKVKREQCTLDTTSCVPIAQHLNRTCLGNHLPYKLTASIPLDEDVTFYSLEFWTALQSIPTCWDKLQYFLCSVYIPECVIIKTSKSTESNQSYSNNYSVSVTNYQEFNREYLPVDNSLSSSSPSFINAYRVVLPEAEMCEAVHKACPLLFSLVYSLNDNNINNAGISHINSSISNSGDDSTISKHSYPKFLDCSLYTPGCRQNKLTARLFQSNGGGCLSPLVTTSLRRNWIPGIERCSFPCRRPHFDSEHYTLARWITGCSAIVCLCTNILTLFTIRLQLAERLEITLQLSAYIHRLIDSLHLPTFSTDRKSHLIYRGKSQLSPTSVVAGVETKATTSSSDTMHNNNNSNNPSWYLLHTSLFYIHLFLIFGCFGWLLPLLPNIGEYVACREDGSLRIGEPQISSGKSVLCIVDFILLYFSSMAAAIWSNIFDYALLYQIKKINFNLSNPQHHHYPSQHHHRHHHDRQDQPHHRYTDLEMKHFQSRVTKLGGNLSRKHNKSSECFTTMQKRISDEPLSEITNSINLTNEKSSEFELCNEEHLIAVNDTAFNATNNNTTDITIEPSISGDCRNKNNKSECKSKKPRLSEFSSSSSASSTSSSPPSMTSTSSLLLLSTQNVDTTKMEECVHLSNILTTTTATINKSHNPKNGLQIKQGKDLAMDHRKLHSLPSHHHDLVCLGSILQHSPVMECVCLNPHHNHYHNRRHYNHATSQNYRQYKCGSFTSIPLDSLIDLLSYDCLNSCIYPSPCFPVSKPLISQILWIQLFTDDKYLFIHNVDTLGTAVDDDNYKHDHDNAEVVDDVDIDNDDAIDGHSLNTTSNFYVTNNAANTTIPTATTCSDMKSLMHRHGVIISSPMHNQMINTQPQTTCLHLLALAIPLVFTLIILTAAEIDGNSLSGICSVGLTNIWARVGLLLAPITLCLVIKFYYFIQLILQFMKLRHKFLLSSFRVDHKIAHRLVRYSLFYSIFLIFLLGLWLFSICIHTYVYLNEPVWLESQRLLLLCRILYRLSGLDELAAMDVCISAASSYESDDKLLSASAFNIRSRHMSVGDNSFFLNGVSVDSHHSSQSLSDLQHQKQHRATQSVRKANNNEGKTTRISTYLPIEEMSVRKPSVGPVLLHLLIYFAINLLYNSMCLLDPSVKRSWFYLLKRIVFWCQWKKQKFSQSLRQKQHHVRAQQYTLRRDFHQNPHHPYIDNLVNDYDSNHNDETNLGIKDNTDYLIKSYLNNITIGFSWWDPGFFTIPTPILSSNDLWIKWNTFYSNEEHIKQLMRKQQNVASSLLSSKQDFELVQCTSSLSAGNNNSVNSTTVLNNCTDDHDTDADTENAGNRYNITDFHVTPDQFNCVMNSLESLLLTATPNDLLESPQHLSALLSKLILLSNTNCLKQSFLDQQHSHLPSTSPSASANNISNNNLEAALFILRQLYQLSSSANIMTANCPQDNFIATNITTNTTSNSSSSSSRSKNTSNLIENLSSNHQYREKNHQSELNSSVNLSGSHLFNNSLSHDSNLQATLTAAVAYEHYQKQLSDLTTNIMRRRSRHKRLLSGRSSIRRHSQSHSLSTNVAFLPNFTSSIGFKINGTNSSTCSTELKPAVKQPFTSILTGTTTTTTAAVSSFSSSSSCLPRRGSFNLLQAAASIIAAAVAAAAPTSNADSIKHNNSSTFDSQRRLSQSGLSGTDAFSTHHLDSSSGAASAFGGSQISSTSIRSALTSVGVSNRHRHHRRRRNNHTRPSSISEALLTNNSNNNISTQNELKSNIDNNIGVSNAKYSATTASNNNNSNLHSMGSRISSVRSISCASSSGAESYNSYRLLINQAGASWRELWRTRMLLMHVLRWAENVAPFMQSNNNTNSSNNVNANVIHSECNKSQISLLNCFDTSMNSTSVDCVKPALITSTSVTATPTTVPACNCNDSRSSAFNVGHQLPIFHPSKINETSDFNAQLVQLIMSLIEKQQQPVYSRTESQSKLDIESQVLTNLSNTKCADEQPSQYPTNSDTTIANSSGTNYTENHYIGQPYPLTSIDPMMAAAFAAATAAATVALQQQHQRQNQQAFRQSPSVNSTSPAGGGAITFSKPTTINNNHTDQFNPSVCINSDDIVNNQSHNDLYPFTTQWTSGSGSLGPLPQDALHSSTSPSNNLSNFVTKNTSPYSQDDYWSPRISSSAFSHYLSPLHNANSLIFHTPHSNGHNNNNQSNSIHCVNTVESYHHHFMPSNSGYATNISDNHHQCTIAPDLLIDHNQLSTGSRDKSINNPSSCSRLFAGGRQQSQPQQLPVNPLIGCYNRSVDSTVNAKTDVLQIPSSASNSQQNRQANASGNLYNILPRRSFYTEQNSTDTILISSQNTDFKPNVNSLLTNSFNKTAVQGDDFSDNNDSDAFNSEDEIVSVNDEDNVNEMDKSLYLNECIESDIKQQGKQLLTYAPSQCNTYEQHVIASITNPNTYFIPNFISSNIHHHRLTTTESTVVTTTLTSMTTYRHPSHPLSAYSSMIMQTKRRIYNVSPDDGEMSSVSQSASQIVPCESSQSSSPSCTDSSSSSPSKLLPKLDPYELDHIVTDYSYSSSGHQQHTNNAQHGYADDVPALTTFLPCDENQSSSHDDTNHIKIVDETTTSTM
ncbi:hypothetical protein MN116_008721 [Schistosoma mekongi]|uniref:G-protein coupled receptors family 2 profile 2 domain-containing protein n=1 Tax=Schistosoma mekongi TaxID=38744 RepID=A0AAE1Z592_SCHME|nr:hypothetical protein MN116_008721 [Schistosoma mekongi]